MTTVPERSAWSSRERLQVDQRNRWGRTEVIFLERLPGGLRLDHVVQLAAGQWGRLLLVLQRRVDGRLVLEALVGYVIVTGGGQPTTTTQLIPLEQIQSAVQGGPGDAKARSA